MKTTTVEKQKDSSCEEMVKNRIQKDADGYYRLPSNLDLEGYPQGVIDSFLDSFKGLSKEKYDWFIRMIKSGEIQMDCPDDSEG